MTTIILQRTLSDGSRIYSVYLSDAERRNGHIEIPCANQRAAEAFGVGLTQLLKRHSP